MNAYYHYIIFSQRSYYNKDEFQRDNFYQEQAANQYEKKYCLN